MLRLCAVGVVAGDESNEAKSGGGGGAAVQQKFRIPSSEVYNELMVSPPTFVVVVTPLAGPTGVVQSRLLRGPAEFRDIAASRRCIVE